MDRRAALSLIGRFSIVSAVSSTWLLGCEVDPWAGTGSNGDCSDRYGVRYFESLNRELSNHPHVTVSIDAAAIEAAIDIGETTFLVRVLESGGGEGDHAHDVSLSLANLETLKDGGSIAITTPEFPGDEHVHTVLIAC